jgi:hypothetical protein
MSDTENKFIVSDNIDKLFSGREVMIKFKYDAKVSRVWVMSFQELVDLQTSIGTFLAGDRLG